MQFLFDIFFIFQPGEFCRLFAAAVANASRIWLKFHLIIDADEFHADDSCWPQLCTLRSVMPQLCPVPYPLAFSCSVDFILILFLYFILCPSCRSLSVSILLVVHARVCVGVCAYIPHPSLNLAKSRLFLLWPKLAWASYNGLHKIIKEKSTSQRSKLQSHLPASQLKV